MKVLNIREMRANMDRLDELVAEEGELVIKRRGHPLPEFCRWRRTVNSLTMLTCVCGWRGCRLLGGTDSCGT